MGSRQQRGVAGLDRYGRAPRAGSADDDRWLGTDAVDPQTAQERYPREGRIDGSGVSGTGAEREANYRAYLQFLNSAFLQLAAGAAHDHFNSSGLLVENENGDRMAVGGDDTLLSKSGPLGAQLAGQAAARSRQAIDDILRTGTTTWTVDAIFRLVPQRVVLRLPAGGEQVMSLAEFQTEVVHDLCRRLLFPQLVGLLPGNPKGDLIRYFGPEMVEGGVEGSPVAPMGDYPVLTGNRG
jgi:hypothetical protein